MNRVDVVTVTSGCSLTAWEVHHRVEKWRIYLNFTTRCSFHYDPWRLPRTAVSAVTKFCFRGGGGKERGKQVIGSVDLVASVADGWNPLQTAARRIWASGDDG